jgi:peptidoglycan/xylan/chitin deacetylase (PgdA/CDA1 family)
MNLVTWYRKAKRWMENKAIVLMYHRVTDLIIDPFELSVSTDNFDQQLQVLKKKFTILSTEEMVHSLQRRNVPSNAVCITFDDGYADNYTNALPLLEKYNCPATFYITTGLVGQPMMYWWDELQYIFLHTPHLPPFLSITINGELLEAHLQNGGFLSVIDWQKSKNWKFEDEPITQRCSLFKTVWGMLKPLPHEQQQKVLKELKGWAKLPIHYQMGYLPITNEELKTISKHPLISLGIHTHTHQSLSLCDNSTQNAEITTCKNILKQYNSTSKSTISYPFGEYNDQTLAIAKKEEINGGFTTSEQLVTNRTSPLIIGRFQVKNWSGSLFEQHLKNWLSRK